MTTDTERLAEARTLLKWYSNLDNYCCTLIYKECGCLHDTKGWHKTPVLLDEGQKARAWLAHDDTPAPVETGKGHMAGLRGDDV